MPSVRDIHFLYQQKRNNGVGRRMEGSAGSLPYFVCGILYHNQNFLVALCDGANSDNGSWDLG